jgi:hypothetical protein
VVLAAVGIAGAQRASEMTSASPTHFHRARRVPATTADLLGPQPPGLRRPLRLVAEVLVRHQVRVPRWGSSWLPRLGERLRSSPDAPPLTAIHDGARLGRLGDHIAFLEVSLWQGSDDGRARSAPC